MDYRTLIKYSLLGCMTGAILFFEPALLFPLLIILSIVLYIYTRPQADRDNLTKIVLAASLVRSIFFCIAIAYIYFSYMNFYEHPLFEKIVGHSVQAVRDFEREIMNGKLIAAYLRGEFGDIQIKDISFQGHGYLHFGAYFQGMLNFLFGESVFNLAVLPILSLWLIVLSYYVAKEIFDRRVAVFSSLIIALLPSINFWSCTNIRTTLGIFGMLFMVYCLTKFFKKNSWRYIFLLFINIFIFSVAKEKLLRSVLFITFLVLFLSINIRFRFKIIILSVIGMAAFIFLIGNVAFQGMFKDVLGDMISSQVGFFSTGGNFYKIYDEFIYNLETIKIMPLGYIIWMVLKALPKGIFYFLFSPFPWHVDNTLRLFAYPQMIFWYFMFMFALLGIFKAALERNSRTLPVIYITSFFMILFSLVLGNEGIAARFRDMISPFFYMFAGSILCNLFLPTEGLKIKQR